MKMVIDPDTLIVPFPVSWTVKTVSYTHLDVYKRQVPASHMKKKEKTPEFIRSDDIEKEFLKAFNQLTYRVSPVSYTHLDVYKRQKQR